MRTCVRMTARPWKPAAELEGALERGDLGYAITLAGEVAEDQRRPIDLRTALRFLPLVAADQPEAYDAWALRWLSRWVTETPGATIDGAVDVAAGLAALPVEPEAIDTIARASESARQRCPAARIYEPSRIDRLRGSGEE
jgi:hypothetical protein